MSDLTMYEIEDIVWDEFDQSDDHIVPQPRDEHASEHSFLGDSCKKTRRGVTGVSCNAGNLYAAKCVGQRKEDKESITLNMTRNMMEKDLWSHTPDGLFSSSCDADSIKEVTSLGSDDTRMSSHCFKTSNITSFGSEFCTDDPIINDKCNLVDGSSYEYPLSHISQTDNDLSFFDDREDKESSDLLYYGWSDIGNFEDVDRMFRSCDSSFGLGVTGNEDELGWFSSGPIEGSEEALKSDFKFPCPQSDALKSISEDPEPPNPNNKRSNHICESNDESKPKEQVNLHKNQSKHQNQMAGKRKDQCLENGGSFYHTCNLQNNDIHLSSMDASRQFFTSIGNRQQKQNLGPGSFGYLQTNNPYLEPDYGHVPNRTIVDPMQSGIKAENEGLTSLSSKESSYASNQVQSMESSRGPSFEGTAIKPDDKREKGHHPQGFQPSFTSNPRHVGMAVQASIYEPVSIQKQVHQPEIEFESQSDYEGFCIGVSPELGSLNAQESSSMNSGLDQISLEATSFCQLQQVTEQLDLRTKLCIRDSLYRLARSAEQRHNYANLNGGNADYRDTSGALMADGTNKCTGFMDMETDTNPIDRSIAHLLFHRPSDSPGMPAQNPLPLKSHMMINGSIASQPTMAEKLVCHEETAAESDDKIADN